jgi:hypothetical protein
MAMVWSRTVLAGVIVAGSACGAPSLSVRLSSAQVRKGQSIKLYLSIAAQEELTAVEISPLAPTGFTLKPENPPPATLSSGSTFTAVYTAQPPNEQLGTGAAADTREEKLFVFNLTWQARNNNQSVTGWQSITAATVLVIAPWAYVCCGMLGVLLGAIIKATTDFAARKKSHPLTIRDYVQDSLSPVLASIAIGFVVLLALAQQTIPAKGWSDCIALGVAIAVFSDQDLLAKVRVVLPKGV